MSKPLPGWYHLPESEHPPSVDDLCEVCERSAGCKKSPHTCMEPDA